jgi:signal transduction histidine kinase
MSSQGDLLRYLVAGGLTVLALSAGVRWWRGRGKVRASIAGALGLLALVSLLNIAGELTHYRYRVMAQVSLVAFLGSGLLLLEFRHRFVPLPRVLRIAAVVAAAGAATFAFVAQLDYGRNVTFHGLDALAMLAVVVVWSVLIFEPIVRFWRASRDRPKVQGARLRSLSGAYALLVVIILFALTLRTDRYPAAAIVMQAAALVLVLGLHAAVSPPRWLRRVWRSSEQQALRASRDLVMFAPGREILATRALDWATRLVGGSSGFIATSEDGVLAACGLADEDARQLAATLSPDEGPAFVPLDGREGGAIVAPIRTEAGTATLAVLSGPYVQLFGSDEIEILGEYAGEIGVALDRVRLTEELQRLDVARRDFISNAAHELRTPLTAILGFSSMLATTPEALAPSKTREALDAMHQQAHRMRKLVNNLVDLAQMEQGKLKVGVSPVSLAGAVREAINEMPPPADHTVEVNVPEVAVLADNQRLEQIIASLLSNAYTYGGPCVRIDATPNGEWVSVAVADDGRGVPDGVRGHLFDPFVRGVEASGAPGSGLGLAIARSLVQAFGGDIRYEDADPGARFVVTLPLAA